MSQLDDLPVLTIESFDSSNDVELERLASENQDSVALIRAKSFSASQFTVQALVELSPAVISAVTAVIAVLIRSRRHHSVKLEGLEITGFSADETREMFELVLEHHDAFQAMAAIEQRRAARAKQFEDSE